MDLEKEMSIVDFSTAGARWNWKWSQEIQLDEDKWFVDYAPLSQ